MRLYFSLPLLRINPTQFRVYDTVKRTRPQFPFVMRKKKKRESRPHINFLALSSFVGESHANTEKGVISANYTMHTLFICLGDLLTEMRKKGLATQ